MTLYINMDDNYGEPRDPNNNYSTMSSSLGLLEIFLALTVVIICSFFIFIIHGCRSNNNKDELPRSWPFIGMLPSLLLHVYPDINIYEWITKCLLNSSCTFLLTGPRFSNMQQILITADPANIRYILSSNDTNFHKGSEYKAIFDILGDGIFNSDSDQWRDQRRTTMAFITHRHFQKFLVRTTTEKVQNELVSFLNDSSEKGSVVDLQDVFRRFTFDSTCKLLIGIDSKCLSTDLVEIPFAAAVDDAVRAVFYRHILPQPVWKLQRWMGVGEEKKLSRAKKTLDIILGKYIEERRKKEMILGKINDEEEEEEEGTDLLASYIHLGFDDRYLKQTILNMFFAGRDTVASALTWLFWNLSEHPLVVKKIRDEINKEMESSDNFIDKLVYLHATICESLRLYPPVPWNHKRAIKPDILPSGHRVDPSNRILFSSYAMGRMPTVWGEDCLEFRPERWITVDNGGIKYEPSHKFVFSAGPRRCLGKDMSFTQIKIVVVNIIHKFDIKAVEAQDVKPGPGVIDLHMKNELKVKVVNRSVDDVH